MMDPCECVDLLNSQALIGHILNLINSQTECTDSHCFTPGEGPLSERLDPSASFITIGFAFVALMMLAILPMNARRGRRQTADKSKDAPHRRGNGGDEPDLAL